MSLDFPATPAQGDRYSPPGGGPSYVFDGGVWKPVVPGMKGVALSHVTASRNTQQEAIPPGPVGIVGAIFINVGGWTSGSTLIGGSGYELIVPADGNYLMRNRTYFNPGAGSPSGRLNITLNGASTSNFVQPPASAAGALTQECTTVHSLIKGHRIAYNIDMATSTFYHASAHTEVEIIRIPDQWEAA